MEIETISEAIKLATAPVFLLTGVGGILNVLGNRLGRVIDRARHVQSLIEDAVDILPAISNTKLDRYHLELVTLEKRKGIINIATALLVLSAVLIAVTVIELFFRPASNQENCNSHCGLPSLLSAAFFLWSVLALCILLKFCMHLTRSNFNQ